ncbi:MAG: 3-ketoacyl-ACP reductase [Spirochaetaceae bacterium]|nr:MAG: 3-ketoacyl-ACP reductase [Spirochaetaceae bacterium]
MSDPKNPVALVTGASRGIGRGIALELARSGYSVAINYAGNHKAAEETLAACTDAGSGRFAAFQANVGNPQDRSRLLSEVWDTFGTIDALVNNAGIGPRQRLDITEATEESFHEVLDINLTGPYFLTQSVVRRWLGTDGDPDSVAASAIESGRKIVFVGSISADAASIQRGEYCVSKAGLAMAARLWATRLAADGIQVYEVRPGITETDMTSGVKAKYDALIGEGLVPQRRWGTPADIGRLVRAILDGDLAFSTGSVIHSDGGFHLPRL